MTDEVFMEVPQVRKIAKTFSEICDALKTVCKILEVVINVLKASAFFGAVGAMAAARFLEMIKPYIEQVAEKCSELCGDVGAAADAYERGDAQGATRFH